MTRRPVELSDAEALELLDLVDASDSVELKLTVPDAEQQSTVQSLGLDPLDAQIRQIFFFDTPDLALNKAGLVVRARRIQGRKHDSVVKLRPVVPEELPKGLRSSPELTVEVDAMPGGYVCSAALKSELG
ncbi:MAG: adenylate cyclase, partial [Solirubrobacterales bacterium]